MHTASSAKRTWSARASTSECTATVLIPSSRQARRILSAISPRFAMRTFLNIGETGSGFLGFLDAKELLTVLHALPVLRENLGHGAGPLRLDFVHQLHRLDDAQRLSWTDDRADVDEGRRVRRGRAVEAADERARDVGVVAAGRVRGSDLGVRAGGGR